ncbi:MAG: hypothetical protein JXA90_06690 [Planctomycetes bacterium]|nr:hypothetical protein [Planctomycetota bacterium]
MPPEPDDAIVDRIAQTVLGRIARRRRRILAARCAGISVSACALIGLALWRAPWPDASRRAPSPESDIVAPTPVPAASTGEPPARSAAGSTARTIPAAPSEASLAASPVRISPRARARELWRDALAARASEREAGGPGTDALGAFLAGALPELDEPTTRTLVHDVRRGALGALERRSPGFTEDFLWALGGMDRARAWPLVEATLEAVGPIPAAIWTAGELRETRAVPLLRRLVLLGDERGEAAAAALRKIPGRDALEALLAAAEGTRGAGELLFPALASEIDAAIREREAEISAYLSASESPRRVLALRALFDIRTETALASMVRALEDPGCRDVARHYLSRAAKRDLGPRPEAWRRWLAEETRT